MASLWRKVLHGGLLAGVITASGKTPETIQGVLIDKHCSYMAETRIVPGPRIEGGMMTAYTHTRQCILMPACQQSGYGVFTYDTNKFLALDEAGNRKALEMLKGSKKEDDFRVEVTGEIQGGVIKVASIKLL